MRHGKPRTPPIFYLTVALTSLSGRRPRNRLRGFPGPVTEALQQQKVVVALLKKSGKIMSSPCSRQPPDPSGQADGRHL